MDSVVLGQSLPARPSCTGPAQRVASGLVPLDSLIKGSTLGLMRGELLS